MAENSKKAQERAEIHKTIWATADKLRGAVDGWDFKQYIIGTIFYRYLSENFIKVKVKQAIQSLIIATLVMKWLMMKNLNKVC